MKAKFDISKAKPSEAFAEVLRDMTAVKRNPEMSFEMVLMRLKIC